MRITQGMLNQQMLTDLQSNYSRLSKLQNEVSTGKRVNTPADDPIGAEFVMRYKGEVASYSQYKDNADAAKSYLDNADGTMNQAVQAMQNARNLTVQAASDTETSSDRQKIAANIDQLYQQMVSIGNSQYQGKYIFNGQMTNVTPYSSVGAEGASTDNGQVLYDVGDGAHLNVNVLGSDFFGKADAPATTDNAFSVLKQLSTTLNDPNATGTQISALLDKFDSRIQTMLTQRADVGAKTNRVTMTQSRLDDLTQNAKTLLANTEDVDMSQAIVDLQAAQNVHQASLQVGARIIQPTLVDFLK